MGAPPRGAPQARRREWLVRRGLARIVREHGCARCVLGGTSGGELHLGNGAAARRVDETQLLAGTIERRETFAHVRQADAVPGAGQDLPQADAVVGDTEDEPTLSEPRRDFDTSRCHAPRESVSNRVLDERLEYEPRHETVEGIPGDVVADAEPVGKSQSLDVQIRLDGD